MAMNNQNGSVRQRTASDVAQLESDLDYHREENDRLQREVAMLSAERSRLQVENAMLEGRAMEHFRKYTRIEAILDNICNGLVSSLRGLKEERAVEREVARRVQAENMRTEGGDPAPAFLRKEAPSERAPARTDQERNEQIRGAAERIAPATPVRPGRVNTALADKDPRLPSNEMMGGLRALANEKEGESHG